MNPKIRESIKTNKVVPDSNRIIQSLTDYKLLVKGIPMMKDLPTKILKVRNKLISKKQYPNKKNNKLEKFRIKEKILINLQRTEKTNQKFKI